MEVLEPGRRFRAVGALGVGSLKVRFTTEVEWLELYPPRRAVMKLSGRGRRSSVQVGSELLLADGADGSTDMEWSADVTVKGTLNKLAARLMKPVTYQMTGEFFNCIKRKIENDVMMDL
jgi:carbon monoxide dehydrogenase subunit G